MAKEQEPKKCQKCGGLGVVPYMDPRNIECRKVCPACEGSGLAGKLG